MLTASKNWMCDRCGKAIKTGEKFQIRAGDFVCADCPETEKQVNQEIESAPVLA